MNSISAAEATFPDAVEASAVVRPASATAHITVPETPIALPVIARCPSALDVTRGADVDLQRIGQMLDGCGERNGNYRLVIAIEALIDGGANTRSRIVGAAQSLGFDRGHAGAVLTKSEGGNPNRHRWQRGAGGVYRLHAGRLAA